MPPKSKDTLCKICHENQFKYKCSGCLLEYCSVPCYKSHKAVCAKAPPASTSTINEPKSNEDVVGDRTSLEAPEDPALPEPKALRPLTSLKWPYIPDESAYPDPLKRDDPKSLQLHQYEAIATSPAVRNILASHPNLKTLLKSIDDKRGPDREYALERALGVTERELTDLSKPQELHEDVLALRELAEAVEMAIRGENRSALGLDWDG